MNVLTDVEKQRDSFKSKWTKREQVVRRTVARAKQQWLCRLLEGQELVAAKRQIRPTAQAS
jgi:hypothetical protein